MTPLLSAASGIPPRRFAARACLALLLLVALASVPALGDDAPTVQWLSSVSADVIAKFDASVLVSRSTDFDPPASVLPMRRIRVGVAATLGASLAGAATPYVLTMWIRHYWSSKMRQAGMVPDFIVADTLNTVAGTVAAVNATRLAGAQIIIGGEGSLCEPSATTAETLAVPHISGQCGTPSVFTCIPSTTGVLPTFCTKAYGRRLTWHHATHHPLSDYFVPFVSLIKIKKGKSLAVASLDSGFQRIVCDNALIAARNAKVPITYTAIFNASQAADPNQLWGIISALKEQNADGVALCMPTCSLALRQMEAMGYAPPALAMLTCVDSPDARNLASTTSAGDRVRYVAGPAQWDPRLSGSDWSSLPTSPSNIYPMDPADDDAVPSPIQFSNDYSATANGAVPGYVEASVMSGFVYMEAALVIYDEPVFDATTYNQALNDIYEPTFFGRIAQNRLGQNDVKPVVLLQPDITMVTQIVAPIESDAVDMVYPMPLWSQRTYDGATYATENLDVAFIVLNFVAIGYLLVMAGFVVRLWKTPAIKSSTPIFSIFNILGALLMLLSNLTWLRFETAATCITHTWLLSLGFTLLFVPLFVKTLRLYKIFKSRKLQVTVVTTAQLGMVVACAVAIEAVILSVWSWGTGIDMYLSTADLLRPSETLTLCKYDNTLLIISLATKGALLIAGVVLTGLIRDLPPQYNESRFIATSIWVLMLICAIVVPIMASGAIDAATQITIRELGVLFVAVSVVSLLILPKIVDAHHGATAVRPIGSALNTKVVTERQPGEKPSSLGSSGESSSTTIAMSSKKPGTQPASGRLASRALPSNSGLVPGAAHDRRTSWAPNGSPIVTQGRMTPAPRLGTALSPTAANPSVNPSANPSPRDLTPSGAAGSEVTPFEAPDNSPMPNSPPPGGVASPSLDHAVLNIPEDDVVTLAS